MITIGTFNIRYPNPDDGINFFPNRLSAVLEKIHTEKPDILGFQELMLDQFEALSEALTEYTFIGESTCPDPAEASDRIAFRKDVLECREWGQFWLSPTPDICGSRYEKQSICPRVCVWARLFCKSSGKELMAVNTHLDHVEAYAREHGLTQIFETLNTMDVPEDMPLFVTGDFNMTPEEPEYQIIKKYGYTDLTAEMGPTFHGFGQEPPVKIDYVLSRKPVSFTRERWHQCIDGVYLSDHDPIMVHWDDTAE